MPDCKPQTPTSSQHCTLVQGDAKDPSSFETTLLALGTPENQSSLLAKVEYRTAEVLEPEDGTSRRALKP